jgi:hypothetical protein
MNLRVLLGYARPYRVNLAQVVHRALDRLTHQITVIVIAHPLSTVRKADHVRELPKSYWRVPAVSLGFMIRSWKARLS